MRIKRRIKKRSDVLRNAGYGLKSTVLLLIASDIQVRLNGLVAFFRSGQLLAPYFLFGRMVKPADYTAQIRQYIYVLFRFHGFITEVRAYIPTSLGWRTGANTNDAPSNAVSLLMSAPAANPRLRIIAAMSSRAMM